MGNAGSLSPPPEYESRSRCALVLLDPGDARVLVNSRLRDTDTRDSIMTYGNEAASIPMSATAGWGISPRFRASYARRVVGEFIIQMILKFI